MGKCMKKTKNCSPVAPKRNQDVGGSNLNTSVKDVRAQTAKRKANTATADKMPRKKRKQDLGADRQEDVKKKEEKKKAPADPPPQKRKRKISAIKHQSDECGDGTSQQPTQQNATQPAPPSAKDGRTSKRPKRKATETDLHVKVPTRKVRDAGEGPSHQNKKRRCDGEETLPSLLGTGGDERNKEEKKKAPEDLPPQKRERKMSPTEDQSDECGKGMFQQKTKQDSYPQRAAFLDKYQQMHKIGNGAFGTVFAGRRRSDNLPVAIKHIPKEDVHYKCVRDDGQKIPVEVDIMMKLKSLGLSAPISLLDWYELNQELILVLERPDPCVNLFEYIQNNGGCIPESKAKIIMKQLVDAAKELEDHEIFHQDIMEENILIETGSDIPHARLIDFGVACFTKNGSFDDSCGPALDFPPEVVMGCTYRACPITVWQLGMILYGAVHRFKDQSERFETIFLLHEKLKIKKRLSKNCKDFLKKCLTLNAKRRATLEQLQRHPWLR